MRFLYVALAVAATLLARTDAISTNFQQKYISRKSVMAKVNVDVKRSLRSNYYEEDSAVSMDDTEERGGGVNYDKLWKLVKSHDAISVEIANLSKHIQKKVAGTLIAQNLSLERFAKKLGMESAHDTPHRNYPFFKQWKEHFLDGKKPKKIPEYWI